MTTKQKAASLIVRLLLAAGLLWGAWHECGPFTWTILCLLAAANEFRILAAWLDRTDRELLDALHTLRATAAVMRRKHDLNKGAHDGRK